MAIGAISGAFSVFMEYRAREPKYVLLMKISSLLIGVGGGLMGLYAIL